jgi:hypothetical protein
MIRMAFFCTFSILCLLLAVIHINHGFSLHINFSNTHFPTFPPFQNQYSFFILGFPRVGWEGLAKKSANNLTVLHLCWLPLKDWGSKTTFADFFPEYNSDILHTNFGRFSAHIYVDSYMREGNQHRHKIKQTSFPLFHLVGFPITDKSLLENFWL